MRGTHLCRGCLLSRERIIPADAGNTSRRLCPLTRIWDHPRGCGEHAMKDGRVSFKKGSSPRMRGTPHMRPSHAYPPKDHPRGCGEHGIPAFALLSQLGSSPRMRGTRGGFVHQKSDNGIIPADAGNTNAYAQANAGARDHPRGCGEHMDKASKKTRAVGSSPRMRGTPNFSGTVGPQKRIIPADAGNTDMPQRHVLGVEDHPRGCGEHMMRDTAAP